jgi:hypothetical protein
MATNTPLESILPGVNESQGVFTIHPYRADVGIVTKTASVTLTALEVATGYVAVTSTSAVVLTMPTGTLLGAQLGATQGYVTVLFIDNTASSGSGIVTMAIGTNAVQADYAVQLTVATASVTPATVTPLTVTVGVSGTAVYRIVFSSSTAYTFSRIG